MDGVTTIQGFALLVMLLLIAYELKTRQAFSRGGFTREKDHPVQYSALILVQSLIIIGLLVSLSSPLWSTSH